MGEKGTMSRTGGVTGFGLSEQEIRDGLEVELLRAMRTEGNAPTVHAIAHSIARILEEDHMRMVAQLQKAGCDVGRLLD
jgi:hypothetical protein